MQAENIDDVLRILDGILAECRAARDPLGYFPALYRQVTLEVKKGIDQGFFDDGPRMERFDALFASRYFEAYEAFRSGGAPSKAWQVAFDATRSGRLIILQDLLVGINAHINLDLGVVTGETFQGAALAGFHGDFLKINAILETLVPQVEAVVGRFSPLLELLSRIGGKDALEVLDFSMDAARDDAWLQANLVALTPPGSRPALIRTIDAKAAFLGRLVSRPPGFVRDTVRIIRSLESRNVPAIIDALNSIVRMDEPALLATVDPARVQP